MKKRFSLLLVAVLILAFATGAVAKDVFETIQAQLRHDFTIKIDGVKREFKNVNGEKVEPVLYNGTTYLPLRAISEIMGKKVYWYEDKKLIEIKDEKDFSTVTDADVIVTTDKNNTKPEKVYDDTGYIGKDKAKAIALDKAGLKESDVTFLKVEFDYDDGIYIYEVEFKKGLTEYSADIKGDDGSILEWDIDTDD